MARLTSHPSFVNLAALQEAGLTGEMIASGISYVHNILDGLDSQLLSAGAFRLSQMFDFARGYFKSLSRQMRASAKKQKPR